MPFRQNHIYPLIDAARFDDVFGAGYDHALLADYGPVDLACWVHDAWIVKANGDVHPGLNVSPVPVIIHDVDEASGWAFQEIIRR